MNARTALYTLLAGAMAALASCTDAPVPAESALEHAEKHLDPTYVCPMHPEITSDEPGKCPICGMALVPAKQPEPAAGPAAGRAPLYYRHPHDPTITSPAPRKDEMGMDFVPVYGDAAGKDADVIRLSAAMTNNLGVRTAAARSGRIARPVETVGTVAFDDRGRVEVRVRAEGYVERLAVRAEGESVRRGQALFAVFSPRLAAAQHEYLHALDLGDAALLEASAARLRALGLDGSAIGRLRQSRTPSDRVTYFAPVSGVVVSLGVREGGLAEPGMSAVTLTPVDRLWVVADVPEAEAARVRAGSAASLTFQALPGERFEARVIEVLPQLQESTRTLQARLAVVNPSGRLASGMLADVVIETEPGEQVVLVPTEALIRTGRAERLVLALGEGRFASREVVAGRESGGEVEIRAGLAPGDVVVVSGQFMIDSESQVRQSLNRFASPTVTENGAGAVAGPDDAAPGGGDPQAEGNANHVHGAAQEQGR